MNSGGDFTLRKDLTRDDFKLFRDWIHLHSGIYLEDTKHDLLRIALMARSTRLGMNEVRDYFRELSTNEDEFKQLMNLVTINETSFFRFPAQFDALRDKVVPEVLGNKRGRENQRFRVWSAGCSTGEEPYTIAMSLLESAVPSADMPIDVVGTDVSTEALDKARGGVYPARNLSGLSQAVVQRWFEPVPGGHRPVKAVRDVCEFHYQNIIKEPLPLMFTGNWDVIFCRNVTIYFKLESTRRVIERFYNALNPGGYLFIGHSETLTSVSDKFEVLEFEGVFLYRKPLGAAFPVGAMPELRAPDSTPRRRASDRRITVNDIVARISGDGATTTSKASGTTPTVVPSRAAEPDKSASQFVDEALALLEQARASEALACANQALLVDPRNVDAHLAAAFAHLDLGQLDEAVAQATAVTETHPLEAGARYILGIISQQRGDLDAALSELRRTLYIDRDYVLAHFAIANIHRSRGEKAEACKAYELCLRSLYVNPQGSWTVFLGGFRPDLLARTCQRSYEECGGTIPR